VLLDPTVEEIRRRITERGDDKTEDWVASHVAWVRDQCDGWTTRIDNTLMDPDETARAVLRSVEQGAGRLVTTFSV
jgi:hypothetical protein